jgi:hypothetical protein
VFIYHEIIDIVNHLVDFGHVRGLMCFAGERALGTIASSVSKGGVHYLKSLYHRYVAKETALTAHLSVKPEYLDNFGVFSDFVLKMVDNPESAVVPNADMNLLYSGVNALLETQDIEGLYRVSPFYRLYKAFEHSKIHLGKNCPFEGFVEWIRKLHDLYRDEDNTQLGCVSTARCSHLVPGPIFSEASDAVCEEECVGSFYFKDFNSLKGDILNNNQELHHRVIIKGVSFQCRGEEHARNHLLSTFSDRKQYSSWCRYVSTKRKYAWPLHTHVIPVSPVVRAPAAAVPKTTVPRTVLKAQNVASVAVKRSSRDITLTADKNSEFSYGSSAAPKSKAARVEQPHFEEARQGASTRSFVHPVSSIFSAQAPRKVVASVQVAAPPTPPVSVKQTKFAQLNYCLRVRLSGDPTVDGLAFGNVTSRATKYEASRWHHKVSDVTSLTLSVLFVCLNDVDSTALALHGLAVDKKFILKTNSKRGYNSIQDLDDIHKVYSPRLPHDPLNPRQSREPILHNLFFIELHPERLKLKYGNVMDDVDKTKKRENNNSYVNTNRKKKKAKPIVNK